MNYWLLKTDPESYSIDNLSADKRTVWDGVRNYQARIFLRQMKKNDKMLIYHSGTEKSVTGMAKVMREAFPDPADSEWAAIEIAFVSKMKTPVTLNRIKNNNELQNILLIRQSRLSVMPLSAEEYAVISNMADDK